MGKSRSSDIILPNNKVAGLLKREANLNTSRLKKPSNWTKKKGKEDVKKSTHTVQSLRILDL